MAWPLHGAMAVQAVASHATRAARGGTASTEAAKTLAVPAAVKSHEEDGVCSVTTTHWA